MLYVHIQNEIKRQMKNWAGTLKNFPCLILPFPFVFPVKQRFSFFRLRHFLIFSLQSAVIQCRRLQLPFNSPPEK